MYLDSDMYNDLDLDGLRKDVHFLSKPKGLKGDEGDFDL
jgi:hypothetical protein